MSPTTGTVTESSAGACVEGSWRNARTSIARETVELRVRKPFSSRLARCFDTDDDDLRPTASPICRVLGE
jgi:hypothetical protein